MLSELSGTPLRGGDTWDDAARARLAQFQSSEGLTPTGMPDDVTVERLKLRYEQILAGRQEAPIQSPSPAAYARVSKGVGEGMQAAQNVAAQLAHDAPLRSQYLHEAKEYSEHILKLFEEGKITEGEAAYLASTFRNQSMNLTRAGLSPAGKALSSFLKAEGASLPVLFERYALKMYGKAPADLTQAERGAIALKIAQKSGATNEAVNVGSRLAPKMSKALMAVAIAIAFYQVATADDPLREAGKQAAGFAGFWVGAKLGAAGGALVCGPGAPACAVIGGIAGGVIGALLMEEAADRTYGAIKG